MNQARYGRSLALVVIAGLLSLICCLALVQNAWGSDPSSVGRYAGNEAVDTAIASSEAAFPEGSRNVVLAREDDYKDSMSATGLAGALEAPILLTSRSSLSEQTANEIRRLGASDVYLIGGEVAIKPDVEKALESLVGEGHVHRIYGMDACDTSVKCAEAIEEIGGGRNELDTAIVATSIDFADALSVSPYAYKYHVPIFITTDSDAPDGDRVLRADAQAMIDEYASVLIPGGPGALPTSSVEGLWGSVEDGGKCTRVFGLTGYDTSTAVASKMIDEGLLTGNVLGVANGAARAKGLDALTSSALLAKNESPLVLVEGTVNTSAAGAFLGNYSDHFERTFIFGGPSVCPEDMVVELDKCLRGAVHYIAVLGSDYWTSSTTDFHLQGSDLMILLRVDTEEACVSYYTIPRDTYYVIRGDDLRPSYPGKTCAEGEYGYDTCNGGKTWYKANYAFHYAYFEAREAGLDHEEATRAGAEKACAAISEITQVQVNNYILCDLMTLQKIVDVFNGGVEIDLPYPIDYSFYDKSHADVTLDAGTQELNGFNAMVAARSRVSYGEDLGLPMDGTRLAVNREMLHALIEHALYSEKYGLGDTGELLKTLVDAGFIQTNIATDDIVAWGNELQESRESLTVYASSGPTDGSSRVFYDLGTDTPNLKPGDEGYETGFKQYVIDYDEEAYLLLSEQLCSGSPFTGAYATEW